MLLQLSGKEVSIPGARTSLSVGRGGELTDASRDVLPPERSQVLAEDTLAFSPGAADLGACA